MFFNLEGSFAARSDYSECCLFLPSFYFVTFSSKERWERCFQQTLLCKGVLLAGNLREIKCTSPGGLQHAEHSEVPPKHGDRSAVPVVTTLKPTKIKGKFVTDFMGFGSSPE